MSPQDLLQSLVEKLGQKLVAYIVNRDASTVSKWQSGQGPTAAEVQRTLMVTFQVVELLETVEATSTVRAWFIGMNPQLDDDSPAEAIREGRHREVMAAARAFVAGG